MSSEARIYVTKGRIYAHITDLSERTTLDVLLRDTGKMESFCSSHPELAEDLDVVRGLKNGKKWGYDGSTKEKARERLEEALGSGEKSEGDWYVYKEDKDGKGFLSNIDGFSQSEVERLPSPADTIYPKDNEGSQREVMRWIGKNYDPDLYAYGRCGECGKDCMGKDVCGIAFCRYGHRMENTVLEGTKFQVKEYIARINRGGTGSTARTGIRSTTVTGRFIYSESESYSTKDSDVRELHQRMYSENRMDMAFKKDGEGNYVPSNPYRTYMEQIPPDSPYCRIGLRLNRMCQSLNDEDTDMGLFFYTFMIDNDLADPGSPLIYRMCGRTVIIRNTEDFIAALFSEPNAIADRLCKDFEKIKETGLLRSKDGTQYGYETIPYIIYEWTGSYSYRDDSGRMVDFGTDYFDHIHETDGRYDERVYMLDQVIDTDSQFKEAICDAYGIDEDIFMDVDIESQYERMFLWGFLTSKRKRIQYKSLDISNGGSGITEIERIVVDAYTDPSEGNRRRYADLCELSRRGSLCDQFTGLKSAICLYDSKGKVLLSIPNIMEYVDRNSKSDIGGVPNVDLYLTCASLLGGNRMDIRIAYGGRVCSLSEHMSAILNSGAGINGVRSFLNDPVVETAEKHIMEMHGQDALKELRADTDRKWEGMSTKISKANKTFDSTVNSRIRSPK